MKNGIDVSGSNVLTEIFDNVDETPEVETPALDVPAEEIPTPEETPDANQEVKPENKPVETPESKPEVKPEDAVSTDKVPAGYVPIPVHAELRAKARLTEDGLRQKLTASQIAQAKAEARAELLEQMVTQAKQEPKTPVQQPKSPLEKFEEEFPGEPVTATVLMEQRRWDQDQADQQKAQAQTQTQEQQVLDGIAAAREMYSADKMGSNELTLDAVVGLARSHGILTQEDVANLAPYGNRAGVVLFNLATTAIKQAGGAPLQELNRRIVSARQALAAKNEQQQQQTTIPKPVVKPVVPEAPVGNKPNSDEDDADVSGITSFMFR